VVGIGLLGVAGAATLFVLGAAAAGEPFLGFAAAAVASGLVGAPAFAVGRPGSEPSRRESLLAVLLLWIAVPLASSIPYVVDGGLPPLDALFEAMSSFTTTGATVLADFGAFGSTLFLWRALGQWVGGIGIIVLFIAVFPQLAIAGRQLFHAEAPGPSEERLTPRLRNTAGAVLTVYVGLTLACLLGYLATGMSGFDAVAHAMTTLAAGGFSPEARSFEAFGAGSQWVATLFMGFAGANFALQYRALVGRPRVLLADPEFRAYVAVALAAGAALTVLLWPEHGPAAAPRHALFQSLSILTTTGYASLDFEAWNGRGQAVLVALMFVGGSAGSAAGGIKVVRLLIAAKNTTREVRRALHPRAVLPVRVGRRIVPEEVLRAVTGFLTLYLTLMLATAGVLILYGSDHLTAVTASLATLGNVGPGLGAVGPMESFAHLAGPAKAALVFAMYAGRLEVVTVFVIFTADWWKLPRRWRPRWGDRRRDPRRDRTRR
jgi:trk system potassium uptake protein TrkH